MAAQPKRSAIIYACSIAFAAWFANYARQFALSHPSVAADCAGDVLWALSVFAAIGLLCPSLPTWQAASGAFVIPALLELGQLYPLPWVDAIRGTTLGYLVLGTEFVVMDFACYAGGALTGMLIEIIVHD